MENIACHLIKLFLHVGEAIKPTEGKFDVNLRNAHLDTFLHLASYEGISKSYPLHCFQFSKLIIHICNRQFQLQEIRKL